MTSIVSAFYYSPGRIRLYFSTIFGLCQAVLGFTRTTERVPHMSRAESLARALHIPAFRRCPLFLAPICTRASQCLLLVAVFALLV